MFKLFSIPKTVFISFFISLHRYRDGGILSDEQAREVEQLLAKKTIIVESLEPDFDEVNGNNDDDDAVAEVESDILNQNIPLETSFDTVQQNESETKSPEPIRTKILVTEEASEELVAIGYPPVASKEVFVNQDGVHFFEDGNFWMEVPGLLDSDKEDDDLEYPVMTKKKSKVRFSSHPIQVYSTFSVNDYDRRNEDVDPVAASAEYELEKRVEKMDVFPVELIKGPEGLGLSIIGTYEYKLSFFLLILICRLLNFVVN